MPYKFKNLVFEGGGVKGIAYGGALEILAEKKILAEIERVAGTSAGAITAGLLALGFSHQEITEILKSTNFRHFMDGSFLGNLFGFIKFYGWFKGKVFQRWFESLVEKKTGSKNTTFAALADKSIIDKKYRLLYVIGTNVNKDETELFSAETTPHMRIADAIRISMSIPIFFRSVKRKGITYVDGGVYYNYPIDLFDNKKYVSPPHSLPITYNPDPDAVYNKETLGLRVDNKDEIARDLKKRATPKTKIKNLKQYVVALVGGLLDNLNKMHIHKNDWHRTIYCDALGVGTTDFDLDPATIDELIQSGRNGAISYLNWFDNPAIDEEQPINK